MPLDIDRISDALLDVTRAMVAREIAPLRAVNADLLARNAELVERSAALEARLGALEARDEPDVPAMLAPLQVAVEQALETAKALSEREPPDVSGFARSADVDARIEALRAEIPPAAVPVDVSGLATKDEVEAVWGSIPDLTGFAEWLDVERAVAEVEQRAASALTERAAEIVAAIPPQPDVSGFATKAEVTDSLAHHDAVIETLANAVKADVEEVRAAIPAPVDTSGFAAKADVDAVKAAIPPDRAPEIASLAERLDGIKMPEVIHGKSIESARVNDDGELIFKRSDGETFNVGKVRGADGFGFEHLSIEDGEREFSIVFAKGERVERFPIRKSVMIYRGVYAEGETYLSGDMVTWAGSLWLATRETADKPETSDAFKLVAKRGRDGKPGTLPAPKPETVKR